MQNIKHIFFDLDHTLWDFETNSKKSFEFIFKQNKIDINIDDFLTTYVPINFNYWKLFREEKVSKEKLRHGRLNDAFNQLNFTITNDLINKLADEYLINLAKYNQLFDGVIELLDYLKPKYKLHIITNGFEETQLSKMKNAKIIHYFDKIITSENVGVKKPNPKVFFYALKKAKAKTYESIMIGDSLEADIYGAKNTGIKAIFFNPETKTCSNNIINVTALLQIKKHL